MGVDRIITTGLALALGTALVCAGPVIASPVAAADGAPAQVRSTDDTTATVDDTSVPTAPLSSFVGSISTPARGETTVHVNGDLVLTPESCPRSPINGWKPYRVFAGFLPSGISSPWATEYPSFDNITTLPTNAFVDKYIDLSAGTYQVYSWALYAEPGGTPARLCERLSDHVVTVVEAVSTQRGIAADDSLVVLGQRTTLTFVERITWSDGAAFSAMQAALAEAVAAGGRVTGGTRVNAGAPDAFYVRPALVEMPDQAGPVLRETFAPILYVMRYSDFDAVLELHNAVPQGLSSSIFTRRSLRVAGSIVVLKSSLAFISPRPLKRWISMPRLPISMLLERISGTLKTGWIFA